MSATNTTPTSDMNPARQCVPPLNARCRQGIYGCELEAYTRLKRRYQNPPREAIAMTQNRYIGVHNLLTPDNCVLLLIDHQPIQFAGIQNMDPTLVISNVAGLAETAK